MSTAAHLAGSQMPSRQGYTEINDISYGRIGNHRVSYDPNLSSEWPIAGKVAACFVAFILCLTIILIPVGVMLAQHALNRQPEMNAYAMQTTLGQAVFQKNGEDGYISLEQAERIGREQSKPVPLDLDVQFGENGFISLSVASRQNGSEITEQREAKCIEKYHGDGRIIHENDERLMMCVFDEHISPKIASAAGKALTTPRGFDMFSFDSYLAQAKGNVRLAFQAFVHEVHKETQDENGDASIGVISYLDKSTNRLYTATFGRSEANIYRKVDNGMASVPLSENLPLQFGVTSVQLKPGDTLILARDGLKENISEREMVNIAEGGKDSIDLLINDANREARCPSYYRGQVDLNNEKKMPVI